MVEGALAKAGIVGEDDLDIANKVFGAVRVEAGADFIIRIVAVEAFAFGIDDREALAHGFHIDQAKRFP